MYRHLLALISLLTPLFLLGQQEEIELFKLGADDLATQQDTGKMSITSASRSSKFLEDLPITVYVVTREEILENGYITLVDVLKDVPGIKVSQPGSGVSGETYLMNGMFGNYYSKVLVDGVPITPSVVSGTIISGNLPVRQAERIEIISGPSSALYGSDALAGVINIITKKSDRPVWSQADLTVGTMGFYNMNVMIGGKFGKNKNVAEYTLHGNYSQQSEMLVKYDIPGNYDSRLYDSLAYLQPFYQGTEDSPEFRRLPQSASQLGFSLKYRGIKATYDHMNRRSHSSIGQSTDLYGYYDPSTYWGENIDKVSLSYENTWNKFSSSSLLSLLVYRMDNNSSFRLITDRGNDGVIYKFSASDDIFFDQLFTYQVNENLELNGGFNVQFSSNLPVTNDLSEPFDINDYHAFSEEVDASDPLLRNFGYNPVNFYNVAGYFQLFYSFYRFNFLAGIRWDEHSLFGSNLSPQLGIQYRATDKLSFRVNYGHGFRTPSLYYVYSSVAYPIETETGTKIFYESLPNPDVKAERFRAFEFGIRHTPLKNLSFEFVLMYHRLRENITFSPIDIDSIQYPNNANQIALSAVNDKNSQAELLSGQINIGVKDIIPSIGLNSELFITLSKGREILPNELGTLDDYRNMPNWMVQWNLDLQLLNKWVIILNNNFTGSSKKRFFPLPPDYMVNVLGRPIEVDAYYTLDIINRFKLNRNFHAFLNINNVFNARYGGIDAYGGLYDLLYNPQYGFHFRLGFSFTME